VVGECAVDDIQEAGAAGRADPAPPAQPVGSLRDFVLANFPLLGSIGGLISIATFVVALPLHAQW
jgi:hypothetical protein